MLKVKEIRNKKNQNIFFLNFLHQLNVGLVERKPEKNMEILE